MRKPSIWGKRTIRNGRIKFFGNYYRPSEKWVAYDGSLDSTRQLFARYRDGNGWKPYIFLWNAPADNAGYINWSWWNKEEV